jgi:peptide/nickel transport system substrate-binding protein
LPQDVGYRWRRLKGQIREEFMLKVLANGAAVLAWTVAAGTMAQAVDGRGGDLVVTQSLEIASLDPLFGSAIGNDRTVLNLFYENLFVIDPEGDLIPRLATDWTMAEDGLSLTANLQAGVRFSDGEPFDAEAVKANIDRVVAQRGTSRMTTLASVIAGAEVIDNDTVKINFERKTGTALSILASEAAMMVAPTALDDPEALRRNPVGTGPFVFKDWQGGFRLAATANPNYWDKGPDGQQLPYLDSVTVRFIADTATSIVEVQSGAAQISDRIQTRDFARVTADPALGLNPNPTEICQFLVFNNSGEPFADNLKLRQAIAAAINPAQIEKVISGGLGKVNPTWVPQSSWEFTADLPVPEYNVAKAKQLYAESGHKGPLTLSIIQRDPDTQISQLIQAQLAQAGITVEIEVLEREAWLEKTRARKHELALLRGNNPLTDPDMRFSGYYLPDSGGNYSAIRDEELIAQVRAAEAETDIEKRKVIYADIQKRLLENAYEVYLSGAPAAEILRKEVSGFQTELVGSWLLGQVRLSD